MREIKFRAWDKQDKRMVVDEQIFILVKVTNKGVIRLSPNHIEDLWDFADSSRFEIMEYTGLKDKNHFEIYEGDIVLLDILNTQNSPMFSDEEKQELFKRGLKIISFQKGMFGFYPVFPELNHIDDKEWCPLLHYSEGELWSDSMNVVGNIHENPELL